ncbi:MAG: PorT family protein [Flavobacteriaceae bacterium]|nr:PorT family protein [Flavobacteriaceae bacterium]
MKKIFLAIAVVIGFGVANAQSVKYGVKAGLNVANVSNVKLGEIEPDSRVAYHVGAMAEIGLTSQFAVQPEVLFSVQGASKEKEGVTGAVEFNYINIPVMAKYYVLNGLSLEVGPQIGFLTTAKITFKGTIEGKEINESKDVKDEAKSVDFGLNFGTSYNYQNFNLGVRYNLGLTDIAKERDGGDANKNGVFQVSLGYFF